MILLRWSVVIVIPLACLSAASSPALLHAEAPVKLTLQELIDGLSGRAQRFLEADSVYLQFAYGPVKRFAKSKMVDRVKGPTITVARRGSNFYAKIVNPIDPRYRSEGHLTVYIADKNILVDTDNRSSATISSGLDAMVYQWWTYTDNLHLNIYKDVPGLDWRRAFPLAKVPILLPEDLYDHRGQYRLLPQQHQVDAVLCHVIERVDVARFFVDTERGFAVVRTELYWTGVKPKRLLKTVRTNRDHKEVRPGLWLPMRQVEDLFASPRHDVPRLWGKRILRRILEVRRLEFDTVTDDFFKVVIPRGILVRDQIRKIEYRSESAGKPFGDAIEFAQGRHQPSLWYWFLLLTGVFAGGLLVYLLVRKIKARRS